MEPQSIIRGKVIKVFPTHILVNHNEYTGFLHISDVSDFYVNDIKIFFEVGNDYEFLVVEVDNKAKRTKLSWKEIVPRHQRNPFKHIIKETGSKFELLKKNTESFFK